MADRIANRNRKIFFINDQYRWEFNYVLTWLLIDVIGRRQRKIKAVEIRKRKHDKQKKCSTKKLQRKSKTITQKSKGNPLKIQQQSSSVSRSQPFPIINGDYEKMPPRLSNSNTIGTTPNSTGKTTIITPSTEPVISKKSKSKNKENTIYETEEGMMYTASEPTKGRSNQIRDYTQVRSRRSNKKKVDYRRANDRGLDSHASFRI